MNKTPSLLTKGLKGPMNIFPLFFFHDDLDNLWQSTSLDMQRLEHMHFGSYLKNLEKAPLSYLSEQDLKVLFFIEAAKVYERIMSDLKRNEEPPIEILFKLESIGEVYKREHCKSSKESFATLASAFVSFFHALMYRGNRSRKLMVLAEHYMEEANLKDEKGRPHPYTLLFKVLTQVGRGLWGEATESLREYSELYPGSHVYKVLIRMYEKIGLTSVANLFREKRQETLERNVAA